MHESYDESYSEWDAVLDDLEEFDAELEVNEAKQTIGELLNQFKTEPVFITIGLSMEEGVHVSTDGDNELLMIALLSSLFKGDLDDQILEQVPKYKPAFPSWGDETPLIFPDKTLWENTNEPE